MRLSALGFAYLCAFAAPTQSAEGHEFYSYECCSDNDCGPLPEGAVTERRDGYHVAPYRHIAGETLVPYGDPRIKESPDGRFHGCEYPMGHLNCLYVPSRAF